MDFIEFPWTLYTKRVDKKGKYKHIMKVDVTVPYNDLPNLPPKHDLETKKILKRCIEARAALAELHKAAEMFPNQTVLINTLPLLEAQGLCRSP